MRYLSRVLYGFAIFIICVTAALLLQIDSSAMSMADALFPGSGRVVCLILLASEAAGACWLYLSFRLRPAKLVIRHNPDDDERLAFAEKLEKRLARNQIVREAGLVPSDEEFAEKAMLLLDKKADDEIRSAGKRIFLGTALAQNGKLDALIVFFSLVRLVWRVSSIYNQRPAPREIMSVYGAVSSATFVAFSLDALDIPRTITDSVSQIVPSAAPAMTAASVPFMGSALHVFTAAAIDGASNCLLAVRAGVAARSAFRYGASGGESLHVSMKETGGLLMDITQETMGAIVKAVKRQMLSVSAATGKKMATAAGAMAEAAAEATENAAGGVIRAAVGLADGMRGALGSRRDGEKDMEEKLSSPAAGEEKKKSFFARLRGK